MDNGNNLKGRPIRAVKVMADYSSFPLWDQGITGPDNVDPRSLPLSDDLVERLNAWAKRFEVGLNRDDPASSMWPSMEEKQAFAEEGLALAREVKRELGPDWDVTAYDHITRETILIPDNGG